ncbi:hypothetical protein DPEC_G00122900 [Dallia pectoralis]|uniref:Uncharacterized protein n=1 Tax=Dallia pectoralis TaxID=75939 RepID=A0ACC2GR59_DALPE|nr:hypothetical protein DPEC_G00122900 [Dallia pectoralis]
MLLGTGGSLAERFSSSQLSSHQSDSTFLRRLVAEVSGNADEVAVSRLVLGHVISPAARSVTSSARP